MKFLVMVWADFFFFLLLHCPSEFPLRGWHWGAHLYTGPSNIALFQCGHWNPHFEIFIQVVLGAVSKGIHWTNSGFKNLLITSKFLLFLFPFDHYITHTIPAFRIFIRIFLSRNFCRNEHWTFSFPSSLSGHNQNSLKQIWDQGFLRTVCSSSV